MHLRKPIWFDGKFEPFEVFVKNFDFETKESFA